MKVYLNGFSYILIALLAIPGFLIARSGLKRKYEVSVFATILVYRITTYVYLALGGTFHPDNLSVFDHKWLGLLIVITTLVFWPKKKLSGYRDALLGLGTGMIIDEISEILSLAGIYFPPAFRDSLPDLALIVGTFLVFIFIRRALAKLKLRVKISA